jgi:hypothetical protein
MYPRRHHRRAARALYRGGPHGLELADGLIETVIAMHITTPARHPHAALKTLLSQG